VFSIDISLSVCYIHIEIKKDLHTDESPKGKRKTMKKILTVLLVMVVAMGFVFATETSTSKTLEIVTTVDVDNLMGFYPYQGTAPASAAETKELINDSNDSINANGSSVTVSLASTSQDLANFGWVSNDTTNSTLTVSSAKLSTSPATTTIGYTLTFADLANSSGTPLSYSAGDSALTLLSDAPGNYGLRYANFAITVALVGDDITNAAKGTYSSTITINNTAF